jgi:hypothetical protein
MRAHVWHTKSPSQRTCQIGSGTTRSPASHEEVRAAQVFSLGDKIVVNSPPTEREDQTFVFFLRERNSENKESGGLTSVSHFGVQAPGSLCQLETPFAHSDSGGLSGK